MPKKKRKVEKIDKSKYKWVGSTTIRSRTDRLTTVAGIGIAIAGKILPRLVIPRHWWMRCDIVSSVPPTAGEQASMSYSQLGMVVPIYQGQSSIEDAADVTLDEMVGRYFREFRANTTGGGFPDFDTEDDAIGTDYGLFGNIETRSSDVKRYGFFERIKDLGLPNNAVITADGTIHYVDHYSTNGGFKPVADPQQPNLLAVTMYADEATQISDVSQYMWGTTSSEVQPDSILDLLYDFFEDPTGAEMVGGVDIAGDLQSWLMTNFSPAAETVTNEAEVLVVRTVLSVTVDVYKDATMRRYLTVR